MQTLKITKKMIKCTNNLPKISKSFFVQLLYKFNFKYYIVKLVTSFKYYRQLLKKQPKAQIVFSLISVIALSENRKGLVYSNVCKRKYNKNE